MEENKPFMTGISLTQREKKIVDKASRQRALNNFSATLRQIINEWAELTGFSFDDESRENGHDQE